MFPLFGSVAGEKDKQSKQLHYKPFYQEIVVEPKSSILKWVELCLIMPERRIKNTIENVILQQTNTKVLRFVICCITIFAVIE